MTDFTTQLRDDVYIAGLEQFCRELLRPGATLVELGSFAGESTAVFARFAARVYAIDPWDDSYSKTVVAGCADPRIVEYLKDVPVPSMSEIEAIFDKRTGIFDNVVKIKDTAENALRRFPDRSVDVVYIDSIHTYRMVKRQIAGWRGKVRPGGVLSGHDFAADTWPGVVRAVEEMIGKPDHLYPDTSWAWRVRG